MKLDRFEREVLKMLSVPGPSGSVDRMMDPETLQQLIAAGHRLVERGLAIRYWDGPRKRWIFDATPQGRRAVAS